MVYKVKLYKRENCFEKIYLRAFVCICVVRRPFAIANFQLSKAKNFWSLIFSAACFMFPISHWLYIMRGLYAKPDHLI